MGQYLGGGAAVATQPKVMTAEELLLLPDDGMDHELIRGELRTMPPPGFRHEAIVAEAIWLLVPFVKATSSVWWSPDRGFGSSAGRTLSALRFRLHLDGPPSGGRSAPWLPGPCSRPPGGGRLSQ